MHQRECTIDEVRVFLGRERPRYQRLVDRLKNDLKALAATPSSRSRIASVYSRSDMGGDELKNPWTICSKVNSIRLGGTDALGRPRKPETSFLIRDLWDIVGVTVVCIFPSDIFEVRELLRDKIVSGKYEEQHGRELGEMLELSGYRGIHYVIHPTDDPNLKDIWCEVQIKSMSSNAWTLKTHDLTYKPRGEIGDVFRRQMRIIGEQLQQIDEQSEIIKEAISRAWQHDTRRQAVALVHGERLHSTWPSDPEVCWASLMLKQNILTDKPIGSEDLARCLRLVDTLERSKNFEAIARLQMMLTVVSDAVTSNDVLHAIQRWKTVTESSQEYGRAWLIQGMVHFIFGNIEDAIEAVESNLEPGVILPNSLLARTHYNLAYLYIVSIHTKQGNDFGAKRKALDNLEKARQFTQRIDEKNGDPADILDKLRMQCRVNDAAGYFDVICGESEDEIKAGLAKCRDSLNASPEPDVARRYFEVHERVAWQRIIDLNSAIADNGHIKLTRIPFNLELFFHLDSNTLILPMDSLRSLRCRPDGVLRGNRMMQEVLAGSRTEKRAPISVTLADDGKYTIVDGNSTYFNAIFSGWPSIAARIESTNLT